MTRVRPGRKFIEDMDMLQYHDSQALKSTLRARQNRRTQMQHQENQRKIRRAIDKKLRRNAK
jgi:hypothetical protein